MQFCIFSSGNYFSGNNWKSTLFGYKNEGSIEEDFTEELFFFKKKKKKIVFEGWIKYLPDEED